jgi:phthalate 4,5-dioxygenase oxygenase subunit
MDRQAQKEGRTFSGVEGFAMQDASVQESMGPIQDRTRENLVPTDQGIIMARRRLIAAMQGLEKDKTPPGTDPRHQRVRSVSIILPRGVAFSEAAEDALLPEPGSAHATV